MFLEGFHRNQSSPAALPRQSLGDMARAYYLLLLGGPPIQDVSKDSSSLKEPQGQD